MSLPFAWVPLIGVVLTVVARVLRTNILWSFILVAAEKLIRYIVLGNLTLQ